MKVAPTCQSQVHLNLTFTGPKVLHQVPPRSIDLSTLSEPTLSGLFKFSAQSSLLIPAPSLSNRPLQLLTPTKPHYRLLSYPITLTSPSYPRNAFTFNFVLLLPEDVGFHSYLPVTAKLAHLFQHLEEHERFLSNELQRSPKPNSGRIYAICEQVLEDLNKYSECMIPIDGTTTTINIKLFPIYPPPPPLYPWQVPLLTVDVKSMSDSSWDLTLLRVLPYIDGVRSMKRIALEADADLKLARKAIRHLLYYDCATLLDIFSFSAIYAPTESIDTFIESEALQEECLNYVLIPDLPALPKTHTQYGHPPAHPSLEANTTTCTRLIELYTSLHQGQSLGSWVLETDPLLPKKIDIRRFITFGVIKRFLYRVHKYALSASAQRRKGQLGLSLDRRKGAGGRANEGELPGKDGLSKFLDGTHSFDEICTEFMISERELTGRLKAYGDMQVICR